MTQDVNTQNDDTPEERFRQDAIALITEQLGEEWVGKPPEEIEAALRETDWYKSRVKLAEDFRP